MVFRVLLPHAPPPMFARGAAGRLSFGPGREGEPGAPVLILVNTSGNRIRLKVRPFSR